MKFIMIKSECKMKLLSIVIIAVMVLTFLPLTAINVNAYRGDGGYADLLEYDATPVSSHSEDIAVLDGDDTDGEIAILLYLALAATFIIIIRGIGIIIIVIIIIRKKKK